MAPRRIPAVFFDIYMDGFSRVVVPEIHLVCRYAGRLDARRLERALLLCLDAEPVAGCRYVPRFIAPYWERLDARELAESTLVREQALSPGQGREQPLRDFLGERIDASGPRARALLLSSPEGDVLALKVDHQIADAAATKAFAYLLCDIYRKLGEEPDFRPEPNPGPRGMDQILSRIPRGRRAGMLRLAMEEGKSTTKPLATLTFSGQGPREGSPAFCLRTLSRERMAAAMEKAQSRGATINDLMLAVVMRALARETAWKPERGALRIMGTVDVRRYLPAGARPGMANLSSMYCLNLEDRLGDDFSETLDRVKARMDRAKDNFLGLPLMVGGMSFIGPLPAGLKKLAVAGPMLAGGRKDNFPPGYTNLGVIEPERLAFEGAAPEHAFCVVPASEPPFFVFGFSGFKGSLTLSSGFYASAQQASRMEALFDVMEQELFS